MSERSSDGPLGLGARLLLLAVVGMTACRPRNRIGPDDAATTMAEASTDDNHRLTLVSAPPGSVPLVVQLEMRRAAAKGRQLIVYEGAPWCEPCKHFHEAVQRGDLDAAFPTLTLLEFDRDRDEQRLNAAGYTSQYIPLFALPGRDGRAAGPKAQGGISGDGKGGDGGVVMLTEKLRELLAAAP